MGPLAIPLPAETHGEFLFDQVETVEALTEETLTTMMVTTTETNQARGDREEGIVRSHRSRGRSHRLSLRGREPLNQLLQSTETGWYCATRSRSTDPLKVAGGVRISILDDMCTVPSAARGSGNFLF